MVKQQTSITILCEGNTEIKYLKYLQTQNYYSIKFNLFHMHHQRPSTKRGVERQLESIQFAQFAILDDSEGEPWQNIKKRCEDEINDTENKAILSSPMFEFFLLHYFENYQDQKLNASITKSNLEKKLNEHMAEYKKAQEFTKRDLPRDKHNKMLNRVGHYRNNKDTQNYTQMYKLFDFLKQYESKFNNAQ